MIRVVHNAVDEVLDCAGCENLEDVLERCGSREESDPHLFTHIRIDGLDLPEDSFCRLAEVSIEGVERIEVESRASTEIALSSLRHSAEYITPVGAALDRVVDLFRRGRTDEANDLLANLSDSLGVLVAAVAGIAAVMPDTAERLVTPVGDLVHWLDQVLEGQSNGDWVFVADILEYEVDPRVEQWGRNMVQVLGEIA
ncbi:MAG: hypothetical protein GY944_13450 [bacterium]|nr:hypothetical protein [bacterium]